MKKNLNEIDIKVINFLLTAGVYSELAIVKNLGITYEELENSYKNLEKNGYLQSYEEYQRENGSEGCNCSHGGCGGCSSATNSGCGGGCCKKNEDTSNVRVITWKAINEFSK